MSSVWFTDLWAKSCTISSAEWAKNGISAGDSVWDSSNGWSLPTSSFTQAQLDMLDVDGNFALNQADGPRDFPPPTDTESDTQSTYAYYLAIKRMYEGMYAPQHASRWFFGDGAPSSVPGSTTSDVYLDRQSGMIYQLT